MNLYNTSVIIAIDLMNEKCVRLTQGNFKKQKIYNNDPLEMALFLEDNCISRLHLVDLDGAKNGKVVHWKILENIAKKTNLVIDFGGGINKEEDIKKVFESGADIAAIGSIGIEKPIILKKWIETYNSDRILLAVDIRDNYIATSGWTKLHKLSIINFLKEKYNNGIRNIFCTDIIKDGSLLGPSFNLYKKIVKKFPNIRLIASGGVSNIKDVQILLKMGCNGVIIGKAFYEKKISFLDIINLKK